MAQQLVIQSNVRYTIKFKRDDCTPRDGKYGLSVAFYVDATWKNPENDEETTLSGCTWYLQEKEAQTLADLGAGKGAVIHAIRKEEHEGERRKYNWHFNVITAGESVGFNLVPFGSKETTGRIGPGEAKKPAAPAAPQEKSTSAPASQPARKIGVKDALTLYTAAYRQCLEAACSLHEESLPEASADATSSTASTLFIQMVKSGADLTLPVVEDPGDLPF